MPGDNPLTYTGKINTRRKIACLPTIFEVVNEEKATPNSTESRLSLRQGLEYEKESKEKNNNAEKALCKKPRRSFVLKMDIEATNRKLSQCNTHMRTAYPDFLPGHQDTTCCGDSNSIQSIRTYRKKACFGLKPVKLCEKQDIFEKQRGIAAWLKFFG